MRLSPLRLAVAAVVSTVAACTLNTAGLGSADSRVSIVLPDAGGAAGSSGDAGRGNVAGAGGNAGMGVAGGAGTGAAGNGAALRQRAAPLDPLGQAKIRDMRQTRAIE